MGSCRSVRIRRRSENIVVELNKKALPMKTYTPVPRPEIYLKDLVVGQGDIVNIKQTVAE